jgi:hypothetical protein
MRGHNFCRRQHTPRTSVRQHERHFLGNVVCTPSFGANGLDTGRRVDGLNLVFLEKYIWA